MSILITRITIGCCLKKESPLSAMKELIGMSKYRFMQMHGKILRLAGIVLRAKSHVSHRLLSLSLLVLSTNFLPAQVIPDPTAGKPNILVIVLDDGRYDSFAPNGGPSFFHSPGINRIANEGVRFEYAFPALSLCSPSRASIMTGLYPHHHGQIRNAKTPSDSFLSPTAARILHDYGYYTGFTGKFGYSVINPGDGFDYWVESSNDLYWNSTYYYNSKKQVLLPGHKTDVITDKALEFLNSVPQGKKFLLYVEHKAPHAPYIRRTQDSGIYKNAPIPFPDNYQSLISNVPSPYNSCCSKPVDSAALKANLEGYYELLAGTESSIDTILTYLENKGILDSTLVIFTSDNGFFFGEHLLDGKEIALEESIRLPMFIRYPAWFTPGTVITDEMAMNIDLAPTMLEAAGIPDTFGMDGISMRGLVNHTASRKELLYEFFNHETCKPTLTAVRDFKFKYISSRCSNIVEEFYDLVNDPKENINLINSPGMSSLIQEYRDKLDSLKQAYGYILMEEVIATCSLENAGNPEGCGISVTKKVTDISGGGSCNDGKIKITPSGNFSSAFHLELYDNSNVLIISADPESGIHPYTFKNLYPGTYHVSVFDGSICQIDLNDLKVKCPAPAGLFASAVSATSVTVNWTNQSCNNGYKLQYRKPGTSSWTTLKPSTNSSSYILTGLSTNTTYQWKVATKCADANPATNSKYSPIQTFSTSLRLSESQYTENHASLLLYPNPAGDMLTAEVDGSDAEFIQLEDPAGRILMAKKIADERLEHIFNVAFLPGGIYLVTVKTASGFLKKSFVKE